MNELTVKYKNELNDIPLRKMTAIEMDFFFAICAKMKNRDNDTLRFSFEDIKTISEYKPTANKRFIKDLENTRNKIMSLSYIEKDGLNSDMFLLFSRFKISADESYVEVKVNTDFSYILNQLTNEFTQFELKEFTNLKSSYAKTMYRLLKQYKSTGYYTIKIEDFRKLLGVPRSYRMSDIDKKIFKPIEKELSAYFDLFEIKKIKALKGNKIARLEFKFTEKEENLLTEVPKITLHNWVE